MTKIYLLPLLLLLVNPVFSQKKAEFGLVLTAGSFTKPNQQNTEDFYGVGQDLRVFRTMHRQKAGSAFAVGVKQSFRLSGYLNLSGELLYRMADFRSSFSTSNTKTDADLAANANVQSQQVSESSIAIPIKLQLSLKKNGRTAIALGAGLAHRLGAKFKGWQDSKSEEYEFLNYRYLYPDMNLGFRDFSSNLLLSAGLYHRLDKNTSLGLEYNFERRSDEVRYNAQYYANIDFLIQCSCYGFVYLKTPNLRSWSLTLSHNLSK